MRISKEIGNRISVGFAILTFSGVGVGLAGCEPKASKPTQTIVYLNRPADKAITPTTLTVKAPEVGANFTFTHLFKGQSLVADFGDIVVGDLNINGLEKAHDERADTGVISSLTNGGTVKATLNEGNVYHLKAGADRKKVLAQLEQEMRDKNPQIKTITIQDIPGDVLQGQIEAPTITSTQTVIETPTPNKVPGPIGINPLETKDIPAGTIMRIDGTVNGVRLFDDNERTGAEIIFEKGASLYANYAGSGLTGLSIDTDMLNQEADRQALASFQANPKFDSITIYTVKANGEITSRVIYRQ